MANGDETLRRAEDALSRGDIAGAERVLAEVWADAKSARPPAVLHLLGSIRLRQGRFANAEDYFREAIKAAPSDARHHAGLGDVLANARHFDHAVGAYGEALRLDPNMPTLKGTYGWACFHAGRFADAEKVARDSLAAQKSSQAWHLLSSSLREQGKHKDALDAAEQGLKLDASSIECVHARAAALASLGREQEALDAFDLVLQRNADTATTAFYRAKAMVSLKRYSDALRVVQEGLARWPADQRLTAAAEELRKKV